MSKDALLLLKINFFVFACFQKIIFVGSIYLFCFWFYSARTYIHARAHTYHIEINLCGRATTDGFFSFYCTYFYFTISWFLSWSTPFLEISTYTVTFHLDTLFRDRPRSGTISRRGFTSVNWAKFIASTATRAQWKMGSIE